MAKGKLLIGLDIGTSGIKFCQLKEGKRNFQLVNFGLALLPPETIVDGALIASNTIVDTLRELFDAHRVRGREVGISVSGHSVIIRKIVLPPMTQEELQESIQWEAEQYIPFDMNDVYLDVEILNTQSVEHNQMDVLLVAAKKDMVSDYVDVVREAGLIPRVVDVDCFSVQNQFEVNYELPLTETVVLINIGASVTNINIVSRGITTFTRDISPLGGNLYTEEIQKQLDVSYEEAEILKAGGELGADADAVVPQEVERVIHAVSEGVASEIQRSLDFYTATSADSHISRIYLSGGTAKIPSLYRIIEQKLGVPVEIINPFKNIEVDGSRFDLEYLRDVAPMAAVATGLALRRVGERR
ncbi:MAG TPA: pilus assembly protein PilM [Myxococcales bacterium]|nr:pilus assembly protein PilM [Deltaproteobacteria bacterium]MBU48180.1 pilus assembly protein PilM [Deltaproteobacteria bacterium]HAA56675.1 pilus assembly protein PilM [Myxococcales bacterium]|tara:strand:+ start:28654 stop:29724 length:1071 start_codon:yes stop_codon:yes gene_type:complete